MIDQYYVIWRPFSQRMVNYLIVMEKTGMLVNSLLDNPIDNSPLLKDICLN